MYILNIFIFCTVWLATQNHSTLVTDTTVVPFLPVNPEYSSTRNQASHGTNVALCLFVYVNTWFNSSAFIFNSMFWYICFFQGRQKLARFSAHEFATLVIDILTDAKRRQWGNSCDSPKGTIYLFIFYNQLWNSLLFLFSFIKVFMEVNIFTSIHTVINTKNKELQ